MGFLGTDELSFLIESTGWTLLLTAIAFVAGGLMGAGIAILRLSRNRIVKSVAIAYIQVLQSIPVLMVLFLSYYGLALAGFDLPPLLAASISLGLYVSAYLAEIWRGSIEAVPYQQWEASASLALSPAQQYAHVILPQAVRISLPPTVGFLVQLVKNTSIVSVVGFVELARAGQLLNNALFKPFAVFGAVAAIYFMICFPLSRLSRHLEKVFHAGRRH
ncbi:MAG TPA: amino acid ABC transporter permease [Beijerinckiaceae bacterium]|jgi:polar amino acid transport system permease protein